MRKFQFSEIGDFDNSIRIAPPAHSNALALAARLLNPHLLVLPYALMTATGALQPPRELRN